VTFQNGKNRIPVLGLDAEWKPPSLPKSASKQRVRLFDTESKIEEGKSGKVAVLQISDGIECLVIQLLYLQEFPDVFRNLLQNPE
jgi:hypothetical protein